MKKEWRDVNGYEGYYQVSNYGDVISLNRSISQGGYSRVIKGRTLKRTINTAGYYSYVLSKNNKKATLREHQIVAIAFLGHVPSGYELVVDHIDGNKTNNHVDNLQIITHRQNISRSKVKCSSKYTGVCWHKHRGKWIVSIQINGKLEHLGYFESEFKAHLTYQSRLTELNNA